MDVWGYLWLAWGVLFVVIESVAIYNDNQETPNGQRSLSDHLRKWFATDTKRGRTAWLIASGLFGAWFIVHIAVPGAV